MCEQSLNDYITEQCALIDAALDRLLPAENESPETIHKAMRYSIFAGGKRMRPVLCLAAAEACGGLAVDALVPACAVENIIVTYFFYCLKMERSRDICC